MRQWLIFTCILLWGVNAEGRKILDTAWYQINYRGSKIGHGWEQCQLDFHDGKWVLVVARRSSLIVSRRGLLLRSNSKLLSRASTDLRPLGFEYSLHQPPETISIIGRRIQGGHMAVNVTLNGRSRQRIIKNVDTMLLASTLKLLPLRYPMPIGVKKSSEIIIEEFGHSAPVEISWRTSGPVPYLAGVVQEMVNRGGGSREIYYLDGKGRTLGYRNLMYQLNHLRMSAKQAVIPFSPPDVTVFIPVGFNMKAPPSIIRARLVIRLKGRAPFDIPQDRRQLIRARHIGNIHRYEATIIALKSDKTASLILPIKLPWMRRYLKPTIYEQSDDPQIISAARRVIGKERRALPAARKLSRWVFKYIGDKNFRSGYASARSVLANRSGDCTEHAVLLGALAKAVGIPSRMVGGIVYHDQAFRLHQWVEVFVGNWIPLDPALNQDQVDATHIKLKSLTSRPEEMLKASLLPGVLSRLKITVKALDYGKGWVHIKKANR